jgi:hypothetical protein
VIVVPHVPYAAHAESAKQHIDAYGTDNPGKVRYGYARWKFGDGEWRMDDEQNIGTP